MSKIVQFKKKTNCKYTKAILLFHATGTIIEMEIEPLMEKLDVDLNGLIEYMYCLESAKFIRLA